MRLHGSASRDHDRIRIVVDDDVAGAASTAADLGGGSFTIELWVRSRPCCNQTPGNPAGSLLADDGWRQGAVLLDRWLGQASVRGWGVSIAGGRVHFGIGADMAGSPLTLAGVRNILDNAWHHVAVVRDVQNSRLTVLVDGVIDAVAQLPGSHADLSYPDAGGLCAAVPRANELHVGGPRDEGAGAPLPWRGWIDELRLFTVARRPTEVLADMARAIPAQTAGLVGSWRMEQGAGQSLSQAAPYDSPAATLLNGASGDGEWTDWNLDPSSAAPLSDTSLPPGFSKTCIVPPQQEPTALAPLGDGRVLLALRNGTVLVIRDGQLLPVPACVLPVAGTSGERGLLDIVADPSAPNAAIYVFRTSPQQRDRVSRFALVGDLVDTSSERLVWEARTSAPEIHHGGALAFLADGTLLVSTGDGAVAARSRDLGSDQGKLLRMRADGSIPSDNPFLAVQGALPEIWARGLRNPFRMAADASGSRVWIGDVGGNVASSWEEINLAAAGVDYGWPEQEGTGCGALPCNSVQLPVAAWRHDDPRYNAGSIGGCVIAGAHYSATRFPAPWRDSLFYADCASRWIRALHFDPAGNVSGESLFEPEPAAGAVVDMCMAADGALLVATYGVGAAGQYEAARVWRYDYAPPGTNTPPVAQLAVSPAAGPAPLDVVFDARASHDPDNPLEVLDYLWEWGDGGTGTGAQASHVYTLEGPRTARLRVRDSHGAAGVAEVQILVGQPPVVQIASPANGTTFRAGETISWTATATDAQDGPLPDAALRSTVAMLHNEHEHPFAGPLPGGSGSFTVPDSGHAPEGVRYAVRIAAVDSSGLAANAAVELGPRTAVVRIETQPAGIAFSVDDDVRSGPYQWTSLEAFRHLLQLPRYAVQQGVALKFERWTDAQAGPKRLLVVPAQGATLRAVYVPVGLDDLVVQLPERAQWTTTAGVGAEDAQSPGNLCVSWSAAASGETLLGGPLPIPRGTDYREARLDVVLSERNGAPRATLACYAQADPPPFVVGSPGSLSAAGPLRVLAQPWDLSTAAPGLHAVSPDLAPLLRSLTGLPSWTPGRRVVFLVLPRPAQGRACFALSTPPVLQVRCAQRPAGSLSGH